jgi:hypothetical protein
VSQQSSYPKCCCPRVNKAGQTGWQTCFITSATDTLSSNNTHKSQSRLSNFANITRDLKIKIMASQATQKDANTSQVRNFPAPNAVHRYQSIHKTKILSAESRTSTRQLLPRGLRQTRGEAPRRRVGVSSPPRPFRHTESRTPSREERPASERRTQGIGV